MKYNPVLLEKTRQALDKSLTRYARDNDTLYKCLRWICYIMIYWANFFNFVYIVSHSMRLMSTEVTYSDNEISTMKNVLYFAIILFVVLTVGYIVMLCKKYIVANVINLVGGVVGMVYFNNLYADSLFHNGMGSAFHYRHGFPLSIMVFVCVWMIYLSVRQEKIERKAYNEFSEKLYVKYNDRLARLSSESDSPVLLNEDEWREFVNEYSEDLYAPQKLKRSRKHKKRKEEQKQTEE